MKMKRILTESWTRVSGMEDLYPHHYTTEEVLLRKPVTLMYIKSSALCKYAICLHTFLKPVSQNFLTDITDTPVWCNHLIGQIIILDLYKET